jgi:hypothetical protein
LKNPTTSESFAEAFVRNTKRQEKLLQGMLGRKM